MSNGRRKPWRREIVWVAALAIAFVVVGWVKVGGFSEDLRDSAVDGCQRQNEIRANLSRTTSILRRLVVVSLSTDPPAITANDRRRREIFEVAIKGLEPLARTKCEAEYP